MGRKTEGQTECGRNTVSLSPIASEPLGALVSQVPQPSQESLILRQNVLVSIALSVSNGDQAVPGLQDVGWCLDRVGLYKCVGDYVSKRINN